MVCVDSDILINFLRKESSALKIINRLNEKDEGLITTSVNSFEILRCASNFSKTKENNIKEFLNSFTILDFDFASSEKAAEIFNDLKNKGNILDIADIMIASIAITNNQSLLTGNKKHFERIKELKLEIS